jgi:hypothetical protein
MIGPRQQLRCGTDRGALAVPGPKRELWSQIGHKTGVFNIAKPLKESGLRGNRGWHFAGKFPRTMSQRPAHQRCSSDESTGFTVARELLFYP